MATGRVELVGTQIGSSGSNGGGGNTIAKVLDGDFTTFYDAANASGDYVGIDTGVGGATVRTVKFAPRRGDSSESALTQYEDRVVGAQIQAADDSAFSSGLVTVDRRVNATGAGWGRLALAVTWLNCAGLPTQDPRPRSLCNLSCRRGAAGFRPVRRRSRSRP